jgi:pyridoxal phosphate-dependent aminotransferase EpsN
MGGGLLALRNAKEKESVRNEIRHGRLPFEKGVAQYVHQTLGFNYQISGYSSALIHFQLPYLEQRLEQKKALFDTYNSAFEPKDWFKPHGDAQSKNHSRWLSCFEVVGRNRNDLCRYLNQNGIDARPTFKPLQTQPAYQGAKHDGGQNAERIANNGISLPSPCNLTEQEQEKVIKTVERWHIW